MSTDDTPPRAAFLARLDTAVTLLWDANRDDSEDAARPNDPEVDVWTAAANLSNTLRKYGDVVRDEVWDLLVPSADAVELHPAPAGPLTATGLVAAQAERIAALSRLLRGMARRHGALRRAYNASGIDPWEDPDYCDNATPASPCGPRLRVSGLCVSCLHEENRKLRDALVVEAGINTMPADEQVIERVARKLHETSEMRMYTWERANASRRHGHWHDVLRERARAVLAVAVSETSDPTAVPHFLHTQEAVEDELRGAGHGDVADLSDIVFVATSAARRALGVCSICDGTGTYPADTEADGYPGPEVCTPCGGTGWAGGEQS